MVWMSPPNSYVDVPVPKVMVLGSGVLGDALVTWVEPSWMRLVSSLGGLGISLPFPCHMMIQYRKILEPKRPPLPHHADTLVLEIHYLKLRNRLVCKLPNLWYFVAAARTKTLFNYMFLSYNFLKINVKKWHCYFKAYGHF